MSDDTRDLIRQAGEAEARLDKAMARLRIAVAEVSLAQATFLVSSGSHWPHGSTQHSEESSDRFEGVLCARAELSDARAKLARLERRR
jgi:hypothetical protein